MKLKERLNQLDPQEADKHLIGIWKGFVETPQFEALELVVGDLKQVANSVILDPNATEPARAFAAGQLSSARQLIDFIKVASNTDPEHLSYATPENGAEPGAARPEEDVQY